jgi:small subunit ribosomal protein S6
MRNYDLVVVLKPSLKEAEQKKVLATVKDWLGKVKVTKEDLWGQKALAYPIKKEVAGVYVDILFESEAGITQDLEKKLIDNENILRHLLIRQ